VGYCQSRQEAETFIKNALEQLVALFTHGNKVDHEAKKVNRELEYTNDSLFEPLNQFTNAVVMLSSLVEQTRSRASSVQRHVFYQNLNALVGPVLNSCVLFTGSADLTSFMAFMANFRSIIDVNSVHVNIFTKLKLALAAPSETTLREVFKQAKLYKTLYHEKLLPALKLIQNGPIPKMFSHYSQSDLQKFKKTIEENTAVMEEIDRYLTIESNVPDDNDSFDFVDQRKRFSRNLADISANSNEDLRKWVNQLINSILLKTT
jgi:hypothetical protein